MRVSDMYPARFMKADDFEEDEVRIVTIKSVEMEELGQGKDKQSKPVIFFRDHEKQLVLNKTNASIIAKFYGDDSDDWFGKKIALHAIEVESFGDIVRAIRVKTTPPTVKVAKTEPQPEVEVSPDETMPPQPATTLGLKPAPVIPSVQKEGKRSLRFGASKLYPALMSWAQKQGFYAVGDQTISARLSNILLGAGIEKFEDTALDTYKQIVTEHYAKKAEVAA